MKIWRGIAAAALLMYGGSVYAGLISYQSGGVDLVYDDDYTPVGASNPGLTWTADANLAATNAFGVTGINANGTMTWDQALDWILGMNDANYGGANDWRLWSALNSDGTGPCGPGFSCDDSELGHLYYIEGSDRTGDPITSSQALSDVFTNLQNAVYWSGTASPSGANAAWDFNASNGRQRSDVVDPSNHVWAVRPGKIQAAPGPGTAVLMALGLVGLGAHRLRRQGASTHS